MSSDNPHDAGQIGQGPPVSAGLVRRGAKLATVGFIATQVIGLATALVLARVLTKDEIGVFFQGTIVAFLGVAFAESGMLGAVIHRKDRLEEAANTALVATMVSGFALSLVAFALAPVIGWFFHKHQHDVTLVAFAAAPLLLTRASTIIPDALLQRRFAFTRRLFVDPGLALSYGAVAIIFALLGFGVWSMVIGTYASHLFLILSTWSFARWRPHPRLASFAMWRELASYGRHLLVGTTSMHVREGVTTFAIGRAFGATGSTNFNYGRRIAQLPQVANWSIAAYVLFPAFARIADDSQRLRSAFLRAYRWLWIVAPAVGGLFLALGDPIMRVMFGPSWGEAGMILAAMAGIGIGEVIISIVVETGKAAGWSAIVTRLSIINLVAGIGLLFAFLPFGIVAAAMSLSVSSLVVAAGALFWIARVVDISKREIFRETFPGTIAALSATAATWVLDRGLVHASHRGFVLDLGGLAVDALAFAIVYLALLGVLAPGRLAEVRRAGGTIISKVRGARGIPA